ncbi:aldehyde decarbonylase [Marchantia polymorpha subsp. ruderalis]|uniref:Fatty acid hydroxylase domain-containing protein n=2 Tax=Marchantia polymorpha TaxID=3197 RepID=A0AAF6APX6_MARPO|nr:hypothetical protein MARPO_0019s0170 [Marchantia polymorpha]BBM98496.1 hypothetical protein Mp_1g14000 [Marchantia polymorpha subsp. ruderalis]|eukprot:PTQ44767.1 hypothetical protein MARPO_0019s0170 [Marchantia polymorpha]
MSMAAKRPYLTASPWHTLRGYKYVVLVPFLIKAIHANYFAGNDVDNWCWHMLLVTFLRLLLAQLWMTFSRMHGIVKKYQIHEGGVTFEQVDREFHSDDHMILEVLLATAVHVWMPGFRFLPLWNTKGLVTIFFIHAGPTEFVYYWLHRFLHTDFLFNNYHHFHHLSVYTEPATAGVSTFLELVLYAGIKGIALLGTIFTGGASISMIYIYWMTFDFLKNMAHCNCEIVPAWAFRTLPFLKYTMITPSYHSLHHTEPATNFCLFMPLYDHLNGTVNKNSDELYDRITAGRQETAPDFVFLPHCVDMLSALQVTFVLRHTAAHPYSSQWYLWFLLPIPILSCICMTIWGKVFVAYKYYLNDIVGQTWVVPRFGFQYFIPQEMKNINSLIESAILEADRTGVKVISLGALNKNEALNGGGALFVQKHPDLRVRVVHGNTLTAACILKGLPEGVTEVFMNGATSKLGRAIALYLVRRRVNVMMLTSSKERFDAIVREAPTHLRHYFTLVTDYRSGKNCKTWIMGKWTRSRDQRWAPKGTHFHQFVVPPVASARKDCTYGKLAAMRMPPHVKGLYSCEVTCERNVVHACHAGGLVHCLEGWAHHEVGGIDVDRIDLVWEAALKHGFLPVSAGEA